MVWLVVVALVYAAAVPVGAELFHDFVLILAVLEVEDSEMSLLLHVNVNCRIRTCALVRTSVCTSERGSLRCILFLEEVERAVCRNCEARLVHYPSDYVEVVARLREEAIAQANRYADTEVVKRNVGHTTLHKIVVVYRGMDMVVCEDVL